MTNSLPRFLGWAPAGAVVVASALVATAAPLLVYTLTLAAFGLPHVLAELRYVDRRFKPRLTPGLGGALLLLIVILFLVRTSALAGVGFVPSQATWELLVLVGLAALTLPVLWRAGPGRRTLGLGVVAAVGFGVVTSPATTLVLLAVLHNLTPIGFLAERLRGAERARAMALCVVGFVVVPGLIASGAVWHGIAAVGLGAREASLLAVGPLESQLGVFVPAGWSGDSLAIHLFSAAVYLQCMHYAVVLHVLPRLQDDDPPAAPETLVPWPRRRPFAWVLAASGALFLAGFALSFGDARAVYGVFAAVHAWIEVPLLLLALAVPAASAVPSPA